MRSGFGSRRKARKVGDDDDDEAETDEPAAQAVDGLVDQQGTVHVVYRVSSIANGGPDSSPVTKASARGSSRPKKKSSLRLSFGPGGAEGEDSHDGGVAVFTPKKSSLSRQAIEKNAARKSSAQTLPPSRLPMRLGEPDDRPSYSEDYLNELKSSTPSTPRDLQGVGNKAVENVEGALDVRGRFPDSAVDDGHVPSQAEIQEKKERRARLAREKEYVGLGGEGSEDGSEDDDERGEVSLRPRKKWAETRLVREDEDLGEGFDEFVEDGRITLGKKAEREQSRQRRKEMQEMIQDAEASSDEGSDDSEAERRAAYEVAQTRAGTYGTRRQDERRPTRPHTPPKINPLPHLAHTLEQLQAALSRLERAKSHKIKKMEDLVQEKSEIAAREVEIQKLLTEAGANYERLSAEAGLGGVLNTSDMAHQTAGPSGPLLIDRGLESFGKASVAPASSD